MVDRVADAAQFKAYVAKLRSKSTQYKDKKAEARGVRACGLPHLSAADGAAQRVCGGVADRSDSGQPGRRSARATGARVPGDSAANASQLELEKKMGVSGFLEAQDKLEQVSAAKSDIDENKGRTLEEISELVQQLNARIADKKTSLAPLVRDLRALRTQSQGLEVPTRPRRPGVTSHRRCTTRRRRASTP